MTELEELEERIVRFVKPLYSDLDGVSHLDRVSRVITIARRLHQPPVRDEAVDFTLLLFFQDLRRWLERAGNLSRTAIAVGPPVTEQRLRKLLGSLGRLESPRSDAERALASAQLVEKSGASGFAEQLARARREGLSMEEVARSEASVPSSAPDWIHPAATDLLAARVRSRVAVAKMIGAEIELVDLS